MLQQSIVHSSTVPVQDAIRDIKYGMKCESHCNVAPRLRQGRFRKCFTVIASVFVDLLDMRSQMGSTSGPSRSPAPSQPQHHTRISMVVSYAANWQTAQRTVLGARGKF
jgi:hypothetical protein